MAFVEKKMQMSLILTKQFLGLGFYLLAGMEFQNTVLCIFFFFNLRNSITRDSFKYFDTETFSISRK